MTRLFTCLLCLVGLNTSALAQDAPKETTPAQKPTQNIKARSNIQTRVRLKVADGKQGGKKQSGKTPRINVVVDRPGAVARGVVLEVAVPGFRIGVQLAPVPPALRAQLGLKKEQGLMVGSVIPKSPAADRSTLKPFDILIAVNGRPLANHEGFSKAVQVAGKQKKPLELTIIRGGKTSIVEIIPAKPKQAERVIVIKGTNLGGARDKLNGLRFEGNLNLEEIEKKIRILTDKGQGRFELDIESSEKNGKKGRFTRSIRISPEGIIVTPRQPSAEVEAGQKAKPRFELRFKTSNETAEGEYSAVLRKLNAVLKRIEKIESTVKKLQKQK